MDDMDRDVILVVEDDEMTRSLLCAALERLGNYIVKKSLDPEEITSLVGNGKTSLVLMDVSLQGVWLDMHQADGLMITRKLKENPATKHVPVVLLSAFAAPGNAEEMLKASGADGYVSKPVDLNFLVSYVEKMLKTQKS